MANKWLNWVESEENCKGKEICRYINCKTNNLIFEKSLNNNSTTNEILNTSYKEISYSIPNNKIKTVETIQLESSGETINEQSTPAEINSLWPSFNIQKEENKSKKKNLLKKQRKHNKKKISKIDVKEENQIFIPIKTTKVPKLKTFLNSLKKTKTEKENPLKAAKHKHKMLNIEINKLKTYESNALMEGVNNLDLLLPYLKKPKLPKGAIPWKSFKTPFPMVYFSITIIEGPFSKRQRRPPSNRKRTTDAKIFLMGLNMPTGYTQITEVLLIKINNSNFRVIK